MINTLQIYDFLLLDFYTENNDSGLPLPSVIVFRYIWSDYEKFESKVLCWTTTLLH